MRWLPSVVVGLSMGLAAVSVIDGFDVRSQLSAQRRKADDLHRKVVDQQDELLAITAAAGQCKDMLTQCLEAFDSFHAAINAAELEEQRRGQKK